MGPHMPPPAPHAGEPAVAQGKPPTVASGVLVAPAPKPIIPSKVVCPVCSTTFAPRASAGRCPVCNEQVIPAEQATRNLPIITPVANWMFQKGNWRLVAVGALILYQLIIFIVLWIHLAHVHAL